MGEQQEGDSLAGKVGRNLEPRQVDLNRAKFAPHFQFAERLLLFATDLGKGKYPRHKSNDGNVSKVMLGIYGKIVFIFWGLIVLAERSLPTSGSMREMVESLVSLWWVAADDTVDRARLFR